MDKLFTSVQYAINHLYDSGDIEAAGKLSVWLDEMMQHAAGGRCSRALNLLQNWSDSAESKSDQSLLYIKTRTIINDLRGTDIWVIARFAFLAKLKKE